MLKADSMIAFSKIQDFKNWIKSEKDMEDPATEWYIVKYYKVKRDCDGVEVWLSQSNNFIVNQWQYYEKLAVDNINCKPKTTNLLLAAYEYGNLDVMKYLIQECHVDPNKMAFDVNKALADLKFIDPTSPEADMSRFLESMISIRSASVDPEVTVRLFSDKRLVWGVGIGAVAFITCLGYTCWPISQEADTDTEAEVE